MASDRADQQRGCEQLLWFHGAESFAASASLWHRLGWHT